MARHKGQFGKVKAGDVFVGHVTNWNISEKAAMHNQSAAGDIWDLNESGIKSWSGSLTLRLDHDAAANQAMRAGDGLTVELYSEGDAVGKTYYSGPVIIEDHGLASPHDGTTERTYSFIGNGPLSVANVTA